ncbi:sensor histidine kinase [Streptacidiphilus cavernicola]|uniref:histidine kinase n=1 Tax=Streptacidiphilus cavernicola TaxID=3342716 RepID=A0ABV6W0U5_9ACTN
MRGLVYMPIGLAAAALVVALILGFLLARSRRAERRERRHREELQATYQELQLTQSQAGREYRTLQEYCVQLAGERDELTAAAKERDQHSGEVLVNLALRSLALVERQLGQLEGMEGTEADSARLEQLYRLDHLATRMRRNNENMLLLGGASHQRPGHAQLPSSLLDVMRAALSEIERYERVHLTAVPQLWIRPDVAEDLSHLFAELLENGTAFSPPGEPVTVTAWQLESGELMVSLVDRGIGLPSELLYEVNSRLASGGSGQPEGSAARTGRSMGLQVVAILALKHGLRVQLRASPTADGTTALVAVPTWVFAAPPAVAPEPDPAAGWDRPAPVVAAVPGPARPLSSVPGTGPDRVAAGGLPKRVPGESGQLARGGGPEAAEQPDGGSPAGAERPGAGAEELRRRLGGFQHGVRAAAPIRREEQGT